MPNNDLNSTNPIGKRSPAGSNPVKVSNEEASGEVLTLISASRERALQAVNSTLIVLYWDIGGMISRKVQFADWGDGVVDELAAYIARKDPNLRGFTRRNLFRMKHFYEAYVNDAIVSPVVAQLPWSHHLIILGQSTRLEERQFYTKLAIQKRWSSQT